jgi:hypothetical protein
MERGFPMRAEFVYRGRYYVPAHDYTGAHCAFRLGERDYLVTIVRQEWRRGFFMVDTRHFNGEPGPEVLLRGVEILERDWTNEQSA